jgi:pimeloyl-ACP methyl ester carboxylesterase
VPLGRARSAVSLGPVAFLSGGAAPPAQAFAGFQPVQVAEDVRIPSDPGVVLAGTLRLPARNGKAPYPVVVVLAGSGPNPRGGFPPLVDRLTEAGIATLDYDKRGIGQSSGSFLDTMEVMERDAAAALRYLRSRPEIDGRRIALLGLSQGGVVGPAVAAEDQGIAALVMLSGPAGEQHKLFLDGMGSALVSGGTRHEAIEAILAAAARYMDAQAEAAPAETIRPLEAALREAFAAGGHPPDKVAQFIATLSHPAVVSQYRVAPNAALRRIKGPVLALYASEDGMTEQSLPQARIALRGNRDAIVAEMPAVNHTFQRQESDAGGKPVFAGAAVSDAATLDVILPWLEKRLEAKRP